MEKARGEIPGFLWFLSAAFCVPAVCFLGVLFAWGTIDSICGRQEVAQFIRQHESLVALRLNNPKVHEFSLRHHPERPSTLLIAFDVDDKQTYELLESDLDAIWDMRFPPKWKTNLRSNEKLSEHWGYAAWGISIVGQIFFRLKVAAALAAVALGLVCWRGICVLNRQTTWQGRGAS